MAQKLILFAENGDSVAETPGTLWDLLANLGEAGAAIDPDKMVVLFVESSGPMRALPLGAALAKTMDDGEKRRTVDALEARAAGYTRLAGHLKELAVDVAPVETEPIVETAPEPARVSTRRKTAIA